MMTMDNVKAFVEKMLRYAEDATTSETVLNFRAQVFGVIMFAQSFLPYDELERYWEGTHTFGDENDEGVWYKFSDIAREKSR